MVDAAADLEVSNRHVRTVCGPSLDGLDCNGAESSDVQYTRLY